MRLTSARRIEKPARGGSETISALNLGPLIAVLLLGVLQSDMRAIFHLAVIRRLLGFTMVLLPREDRSDFTAKSKVDMRWSRFPQT